MQTGSNPVSQEALLSPKKLGCPYLEALWQKEGGGLSEKVIFELGLGSCIQLVQGR